MEFTRKCPSCKREINYSNKYKLQKAVSKNSVCNKCNGGKSWGIHNKLINIGKRKHPNSGKKYSHDRKKICVNINIKEGKLNGMFCRSNYNIWLEKYGKEIADKKLIEFKAKISKATSGKNNPMYGRPAPQGSGNGWQGYYNNLKFRSLLELSFLINICERFNFKVESCENSKFRVNYKIDGVDRTYYPDFILNDLYVIEVKPKNLHNSRIVKIKEKYARKQFESFGLKYKMIDCKRIDNFKLKELVDSGQVVFDKRYSIKYKQYDFK